MYSKLLVPLDGSELSEKSLPYVEEIARGLGCHVLMLSICEHGHTPENLAWRYLSEKAKLLKSQGINTSTVVALGDPSDGIVDFSAKNAIDLIVMSTHGRAGVSRWATGSVCNKVIQKSTLPVLLVRAMTPIDKMNGFRKILVPLDGSRFSEHVIPYVTDIASTLKSDITLLRINDAGEFHGQITSEIATSWENYRKEAVDNTEKTIHQYLEEIKERIRLNNSIVQLETIQGKAAEEIVDYAESNDVGMIALSTHGWSGIDRWAFGSVASKVVATSTKPTLLIRPKPTVINEQRDKKTAMC